MAEEAIKYGVILEDHMSGVAKDIAKAIKEAGKESEKTKTIFEKLKDGLTKTIEPTEILRHAFEGVSEGFRNMSAGLKAGELKEVVGGIFESLAGISQMLDLLVPGLGQLASAVIKVDGAIASMLVGLIQGGAELAIEATQAKQAMISMFGALGGGEEMGRATEDMLSDLSKKIGITKDELAPLTKSFMAMGIVGTEALERVTLAAESAKAIMGDPAAAQAFINLKEKIVLASEAGHGLKIPEKGLKALFHAGVNANDVASRLGVSTETLMKRLKDGTQDAFAFGEAMEDALIAKGAKPIDRMGASLGNLKKMFKQNIEDMFEDMGAAIEPFLDKVKQLISLFDQSSVSGQVMKEGIEGAFTAIFEAASEAIVPIGDMFLDLLIISVDTYTLIKSHWKEISAGFVDIQVPLQAVVLMFDRIAVAVDAIVKADAAIRGFVSTTAGMGTVADKAGRNVSTGLAGGMKDGIADVKKAGESLGAAGKVAVNASFENKSPSRAMFRAGAHASAGLSLGMRAGRTGVAREARAVGIGAVRNVGASIRASDYTPRAGVANTRQPHGEAGGGGARVQGVTINITAPNGVTGAQELTEIAVATLFERLSLQQGT